MIPGTSGRTSSFAIVVSIGTSSYSEGIGWNRKRTGFFLQRAFRWRYALLYGTDVYKSLIWNKYNCSVSELPGLKRPGIFSEGNVYEAT